MARASKNDNSGSVNESNSGARKPLPDAFPGETYESTRDLDKEYAQDIDKEEHVLSDKVPSEKAEYDAQDPSEIAEDIKAKKAKEPKEKIKYIKHDDGMDEDETEEKEHVEESETEEEVDELDDSLIERAFNAGMDQDDVEDFKTNADLRKHVKIIEKINLKNNFQKSKADEEIPAKKKSEESGKADEEMLKLDLSDEIYEPKVVETLNKLNKHYHDKVSSLVKEVKTLTSFIESNEAKEKEKADMAVMLTFDKEVNELIKNKDNGEFWKKEFGEGDHTTLGKKSVEFKKRSELWAEVVALDKVYAEMGRRTDLQTLIKKALNSLYEDQAMKIAKTELGNKLKKREKLITSRVTSRDNGDSGLSRKQIAIKNARERMAKFSEE